MSHLIPYSLRQSLIPRQPRHCKAQPGMCFPFRLRFQPISFRSSVLPVFPIWLIRDRFRHTVLRTVPPADGIFQKSVPTDLREFRCRYPRPRRRGCRSQGCRSQVAGRRSPCNLPPVTCNLSPATCNPSPVTCSLPPQSRPKVSHIPDA